MIQDTGIDIVVLNCNNYGFIQPCLKSIIDNTPAPYNLIVVDQNSQDGTRDWLLSFQSISHLILNKMNVGVAEGRNQGIRAGKYPWIAFIDSDVEIKDKEWVDKMWNYTIDHHIGFIEGENLSTSFALVRRKCFNEIGMFDSNFVICENIEWMVRLKWNKYWRKAICPELDVIHSGGQTTIKGILKNKSVEMSVEMSKLLMFKYNEDFIMKMLNGN